MRKIVWLIILSLVLSLCACGQSEIEKAKSLYNDGNYEEAFSLLKQMRDKSPDDVSEELAGYIYGCAYHLLQTELQKHGDKQYAVSDLPDSKNYAIYVKDFDDRICISYEGTTVYVDTYNGSYSDTFRNYFFYLPEPADTPVVPEAFEWFYAQSDVLKYYEEIAKADGTLDPSYWFTLSNDGSNTYFNCRYTTNHHSGNRAEASNGTKDCFYELMTRIDSVFSLINIGVNYTDFGFEDLEKALNSL